MRIGLEDVNEQRANYPEAKVVVHPECRPEVIDAADEALSTGGIIRYARSYRGSTLIVGTETGILHRLQKENPAVEYVPVTERGLCPNMKRITLEKILWSMQEMEPEIEVPEDIRRRALAAVERMLKL
jgi:quinolinate synthase